MGRAKRDRRKEQQIIDSMRKGRVAARLEIILENTGVPGRHKTTVNGIPDTYEGAIEVLHKAQIAIGRLFLQKAIDGGVEQDGETFRLLKGKRSPIITPGSVVPPITPGKGWGASHAEGETENAAPKIRVGGKGRVRNL